MKIIPSLAAWLRRPLKTNRTKLIFLLIPCIFAPPAYLYYYIGIKGYGAWSLLYALFSTLRMYTLCFDVPLADLHAAEPAFALWAIIFLEISRWAGVAIVGTFFLTLMRTLSTRLRAFITARRRDAIAVHGSPRYKAILKKALGGHVIVSNTPETFRARRHILAFDSNRELIDFLNANYSQFPPVTEGSDAGIYLCVQGSVPSRHGETGFIINNIPEDCARLYWRNHYVRRYGKAQESRIAIIGFGAVGQALLTQALMVNVFPGDQAPMRYFVYGDAGTYAGLHPGIAQFTAAQPAPGMDQLVFSEKPWQQDMATLLSCDRIILADDAQERNIEALGALGEMNPQMPIHLYAHDSQMIVAMFSDLRIGTPDAQVTVFGTDETLFTREAILEEQLLLGAKMIHAQYMKTSGADACAQCSETSCRACAVSCPHFKANWRRESTYAKLSSLYAADHLDVKLRSVLERDCAVSAETIAAYRAALGGIHDARKESLMETEHRRWMRRMYLSGWTYAPTRDNSARQHPLLLPYDQLSKAQQFKDWDAYVTLEHVIL